VFLIQVDIPFSLVVMENSARKKHPRLQKLLSRSWHSDTSMLLGSSLTPLREKRAKNTRLAADDIAVTVLVGVDLSLAADDNVSLPTLSILPLPSPFSSIHYKHFVPGH